ncbi:MAG: MarR family transcriptional regulator [Chloroflexi bacterium]|nr:MAG: MarR family transcriptional regulator [Chloroflexota bacterium]
MSSDTTSSYLTSRWGGRILRPVSRKRDEHDKLDDWLDIWTREIPNLDPVTEGIVERIQNLYKDFDRSMEETLTKHDLDRRAFHLLGRLRSYGPPYRRSPGQLAGDMRLSSGAMTNRLDRLEAAGLIRRLPDPNDRRGQLIEPTAKGHAAWERTVGTQAERERRIASVLTATEREQLHRLLRRLMQAFPDREKWYHPAGDAEKGDRDEKPADKPAA